MAERSVNINEILEDHKNIEILKLLQRNPRMSIAELARKIRMSNPAAKERVRRLEKSGVIAGYRLELDPKAAGHDITAFVARNCFFGPGAGSFSCSWADDDVHCAVLARPAAVATAFAHTPSQEQETCVTLTSTI